MSRGRIYVVKISLWIISFLVCLFWAFWFWFMFSLKSVENCVTNLNSLSRSRLKIFLSEEIFHFWKRIYNTGLQLANIYMKCHLQVLTLKKGQKCTQVKLVLLSPEQGQLLMNWVSNLSLEKCYDFNLRVLDQRNDVNVHS